MTHRVFGIRHHGPGSARRLREALAVYQPDLVLVEGPPDANELISWLAHEDMEPPVALLVYNADDPAQAVNYPYAEFSPEYQALRFALAQGVPAAFMDLPQAIQLMLPAEPGAPSAPALQALARSADFPHYEAWWHQTVERPLDGEDVFTAVQEMMTAAREMIQENGQPSHHRTLMREAYMRHIIRQGVQQGYGRIAVVCGAWHVPALLSLDSVTADAFLLRGVSAVAVEAAWVPWTYGRLALSSGYGAGILSPGWYHHLWEMGNLQVPVEETAVHWLVQVANLLRQQGMDATPAHVIEAVRLVQALAALRERPYPSLAEMNDAVKAVFCGGASEPLELIRHQLIIREKMGRVPDDSPLTPFQRDLAEQQRKLNLLPEPEKTTLTLDLRQPVDLERSHLLHRLQLLAIPWGQPIKVRTPDGTYQEIWQLRWLPDFQVRVVEAGMWGHSVAEAAAALASDKAQKAQDLSALTELLDKLILAELLAVVPEVMDRIEDEAAVSRDIVRLMAAVPPLARVLRYGSVRQTDVGVVQQVVDGLLTRICVGLPSSCMRLDEDAAEEMELHVTAVHHVVHTLAQQAHLTAWHDVLMRLLTQAFTPGLLAGRACRLLLDAQAITQETAAHHLARVLNPAKTKTFNAAELTDTAGWLEGFLKGSDLLLIHDRVLWQILDAWVRRLPDDQFQLMLPLLRRGFSRFSKGAKQQLGRQVLQMPALAVENTAVISGFDEKRANKVLPLLAQLLGLDNSGLPETDSRREIADGE